MAKPPSQRRASKTAFFGQWLSLHILRAAPGVAAGTLYVATPKKLAKRAIHRNMVRRVIKEQWRLQRKGLQRIHPESNRTDVGSGGVSPAGVASLDVVGSLSLLVRLHALPSIDKAAVTKSNLTSLQRRLPDGAFKRAIASDFNQQLALLHSVQKSSARNTAQRPAP